MISTRYLLILTIGLTCTAALAQSTTQPAQPARPFAGGGAFGGGNGAGGGGGRGEMFIQRVRDQLTDLKLTDDQTKKIDDILDKAKDDMRDLAQQLQTMQPQERQEKIRDLLMGVRDKIKAELTPDQADKFQQKIDALRQRGGGGGGRFGGGANGGGNGAANTNASTTQPSNSPQATGPQGQQGPQRLDAIVQRLNDSLAALNLTGDQKSQVSKVLDQTKTQLQDLRTKVRNGGTSPDDMRSQAQDILSSTRDQLAGILTKDQQEQLRDEIQKRLDQTSPATRPSTRPTVMADPTMQEKPIQATGSSAMMDASSTDKSSASGASAKGSTPAAFLVSTGPKVGDPAPAFNLNKLDGHPVQLSFFKGRPLVIEFGSYTSPTFREQASKMEELARQYNGRAAFLVVYTKEAHPQGGWEVDRNHDDRISLAQPADLTARNAAAKDAKLALKITIPIAVDTMDNTLATAIGAGENSAVVIGKDGSIVARQAWCDPFRLRVALDQAIMHSVSIAK